MESNWSPVIRIGNYIIIFQENGILPPNRAGVVLADPQYYVNLSADEIERSVDDDGNCWVEDFSIGHRIYGSAYFPGQTNIANLSLDKIGNICYR